MFIVLQKVDQNLIKNSFISTNTALSTKVKSVVTFELNKNE